MKRRIIWSIAIVEVIFLIISISAAILHYTEPDSQETIDYLVTVANDTVKNKGEKIDIDPKIGVEVNLKNHKQEHIIIVKTKNTEVLTVADENWNIKETNVDSKNIAHIEYVIIYMLTFNFIFAFAFIILNGTDDLPVIESRKK